MIPVTHLSICKYNHSAYHWKHTRDKPVSMKRDIHTLSLHSSYKYVNIIVNIVCCVVITYIED